MANGNLPRRSTEIAFPRRLALVLALGVGLGAPAAGDPAPITIDFDTMSLGASPSGFTLGLTGEGPPAEWIVETDPADPSRRNVLGQISTDRTGQRFPVCLYDGFRARNLDVSVRLKLVAGEADQSGGLIVRATDARNYYVVGVNALEQTVRLYRVIGGMATFFAGTRTKVRAEEWQTLRIKVEGDRFYVVWNGAPLFEARDGQLSAPGRVGLWTKSDSVTLFDDLTIRPGSD
ncbi:MAG: hypothetical protein U1F33_08020 [Alphaproteobacteria bacterium]